MKFLFLLFCFIPSLLPAQDRELVAEGVSPSLYVTHTVQAKENYYSIGRLYNISPKEIAPFNKLELEKGLSVGQVIRIPLNATNFSQTKAAAPDETLVPVVHVVKEKEGLYRIAQNHNKIPVDQLKSLNKLKGDAVSNGTKLVVGYLKVKSDKAALSKPAVIKEDVVTTVIKKPVPAPAKSEEKIMPVPTQPVINNTGSDAPETGVKKNQPVKEEEKSQAVAGQPVNFKGGTFKKQYSREEDNNEKAEGMAGVFKSTSGWTDGKYYCLHNTAAPNTIIKITSTVTGKSIYAKVLDVMPDLKQNAGLLVRISNAAADELGMSETNFSCTINYTK